MKDNLIGINSDFERPKIHVSGPMAVREKPNQDNLGAFISFLFRIGDCVIIDGHKDIHGIVTGLAHFEFHDEIRVEWFANGDAKQFWFSASLLKRID